MVKFDTIVNGLKAKWLVQASPIGLLHAHAHVVTAKDVQCKVSGPARPQPPVGCERPPVCRVTCGSLGEYRSEVAFDQLRVKPALNRPPAGITGAAEPSRSESSGPAIGSMQMNGAPSGDQTIAQPNP